MAFAIRREPAEAESSVLCAAAHIEGTTGDYMAQRYASAQVGDVGAGLRFGILQHGPEPIPYE